jgi:Methyltransferase domain
MALPPPQDLPLDPIWPDEETYIESLLSFATSSELFRNLCGGIHVLDFLTRKPDIYATVLPQDWRDWFERVDVHDVLQLLLREDLAPLLSSQQQTSWKNGPAPPESLLKYILTIKRHCLLRTYSPTLSEADIKALPRRQVGGMKPKKIHEVQHFSAYVERLSQFVAKETGEPVSGVVDFGSGQGYLGRTLASPPYHQKVIAIERKHHNVAGAKKKDVQAKLAKAEKMMRNKKDYKRQMMIEKAAAVNGDCSNQGCTTSPPSCMSPAVIEKASEVGPNGFIIDIEPDTFDGQIGIGGVMHLHPVAVEASEVKLNDSITHIEHNIVDGQIEDVIHLSPNDGTSPTISTSPSAANLPKLMVISLHSCGNLSHHGLRTLSPRLNPSISAVALIGCCYNLVTERLGPATYPSPILRPQHPRLEATGSARDPHGFPMSDRLAHFENDNHNDNHHYKSSPIGLRLNITARMLALQAPHNWGRQDSDAFFQRHFYRALFQRLLYDHGLISPESPNLTIGPLPASAFTSFPAYVHAAATKLALQNTLPPSFFSPATLESYESRFVRSRHHLACMWSLMAFSAGVAESLVVVDRWLWLREQKGWIGRCWVQAVFDYTISPRNLVVVGVRCGEKGKEGEGE